jgi:hypothetical protein
MTIFRENDLFFKQGLISVRIKNQTNENNKLHR